MADEIVDLGAETTIARISGFVGRPDSARKTVPNQFFFVNGRYFRSPYLHKAVMKAYEGLLPEGYVPAYFIYLDVDPASIDVNIHPQKTEIKFEEDRTLFQILYACVHETLGRNSFGGSIDFDLAGAPELPQLGEGFRAYTGGAAAPIQGYDPAYNPFHEPERFDALFDGFESESPAAPAPAQRDVLVLGGRYILTPTPEGLLAVSIKRARERILYDRALKALSENEHVSQRALFPEQVRVGAENVPVFEAHARELEALGFEITPFGADTIVVGGVPEGYSLEPGKVCQMVSDLMVILSEDSSTFLPELMQSNLAKKFALLGASCADEILSKEAAGALLDALFHSSQSDFTASGKRITRILPMEEIDKKF